METILDADERLLCRPPVEVLKIARILLDDMWLWSQGARARDEEGLPVPPNHPRACCWSITGAIAVASNPYGITPPFFLRVLDARAWELGLLRRVMPPLSRRDEELDAQLPPTMTYDSVDDFNDYCYHGHVLELLDSTIAMLE
jgi:hypothetical protein